MADPAGVQFLHANERLNPGGISYEMLQSRKSSRSLGNTRLMNANAERRLASSFFVIIWILVASMQPVTGDDTTKPTATVAYWVTQLSHPHYLRREAAEQSLIQAGPDAVDDLADVMLEGDLETIERASSALTQIAIDHHPSKDGGAWKTLSSLSTSTTGLVCASTRRAAEEIRQQRGNRALKELAKAGVSVGEDDFMIRAISERRLIVQIDEKWNGDITALDWLRWLDRVNTARIVGPAVSKEVLKRVAKMPELESLALVEGTLESKDDLRTADSRVQTLRSVDLRYVPLSKAAVNHHRVDSDSRFNHADGHGNHRRRCRVDAVRCPRRRN